MHYKTVPFLIIVFFGLYIQDGRAQALNIYGDTIFVNMEAEIQLVFPTLPTSFTTIPDDNQFQVWASRTGINVIAGSEDYNPVTLVISEAQRKHRFILVFKKEIKNKEAKLYYDYSTIKKLADHIRETSFPKSVSPEETVAKESSKQDNKINKKEVTNTEPGRSENDKKYLAIIETARDRMDQKNYTQAREAYEQALNLRPGDIFSSQQLQKIIILLAEEGDQKEQQKRKNLNNETAAKARRELSDKQLSDQTNYDTAVRSADNFFKVADYVNAKSAYNKALTFLEKDYPAVQIGKINKILTAQANEEKKRSDRQKIDVDQQTNYDASVASGDTFFKAGDYENAKAEYIKALGFIKKDYPAIQINKINKALAAQVAQANEERKRLEQQKIATEQKTNYDSAVFSGDNFFKAGNYELAKAAYNKSLGFIKNDYPADQVDKINKILAAQLLRANEEKKTQDQQKIIEAQKAKPDNTARPAEIKKKYAIAMTQGKSSYLKNELSNAKAFYEEAMNLQPSMQEPKSQLKIINDKLEDSLKEAKIDDKYWQVIAIADSQVNVKNFEAAIPVYGEASLIKPLESYPGKQIKYLQSELARIEKTKKEEREQQYIDALIRADQAVTDKKYDEARSAYTLALSIHSDNDYAKKRLEIVSYQAEIEKEKVRAEKLKEDSIKAIPVKKIKRNKSAGK